MFEIIRKEKLGKDMYSLEIYAPRVAKVALPGQFIILVVDKFGERIPLTIYDSNIKTGGVTIVVQVLGYSTKKLTTMNEGERLEAFVGPLGNPSSFVKLEDEKIKGKKYLFIAGGLGVAPIYPQIKWLKARGAEIEVIMGARNKELIILEDEIREFADEVYITTDDGSYGFKGMVTDKLVDLYENKNKKYDQCICIGPMIMMKFVTLTVKKYDLDIVVSMNTLMVDGTGMCGACRLSVNEETKFACVDGPEFDGYLVDFDEALNRIVQFKDEEQCVKEKCRCKGEEENE